jgi:pilus assembly protein Flp/PilA
MHAIGRKIREFMVSDDGPTAVEYAVIISLILLVCFSAIAVFGNKTNQSLTHSASSLPS